MRVTLSWWISVSVPSQSSARVLALRIRYNMARGTEGHREGTSQESGVTREGTTKYDLVDQTLEKYQST